MSRDRRCAVRRGAGTHLAVASLLVTITLAGCAGSGGGSGDGSGRHRQATWPVDRAGATSDAPTAGTGDDPLGIAAGARSAESQAEADAQWLEARRRSAASTSDPTGDGSVVFHDPPARPGPPVPWDRGQASRDARERADADGGAARRSLAVPEQRPATGDPLPVRTDVPGADPDAVIASDEFTTLLVRLRQELFAQSERSRHPMREAVAMALMSLLDPDATIDPGSLRALTDAERQRVQDLQRVFGTLGRELVAGKPAGDALAEAAAALNAALTPEPQLTIRVASLCWSVSAFGRYDAFDPLRFLAGAEQEVIVYLEIDGFRSEQRSDGSWVTELSQQLEIYNAIDRFPVWMEPWQRTVDTNANQRRDFYTVWLVRLPAALTPGRYHFKARIRDERSKAEAEAGIDFEMVADRHRAVRVPAK